MKRTMKLGFLALMVAALAFAFSSSSMAFHESTKLICSKCHTMHGSGGGTPEQLLSEANKTVLCLVCHASNYPVAYPVGDDEYAPNVHSSGEGVQDTPGGSYADSGTEALQANGHNPSGFPADPPAASPLIEVDTTLTQIPPGATALWEWSCLSCHRPHKDDNDTAPRTATYEYRMLRKHVKGPSAAGADTLIDVSLALGLDDDHEVTPLANVGANVNAEAPTKHNVYFMDSTNTGFGEWCGGCHTDFHDSTQDVDDNWIRHPGQQLLEALGANYVVTTPPYDPSVPVQVNSGAGLETNSSAFNGGITTTTDLQVTCLSCHKAHATEYPNLVRWDLTEPNAGNCNKCHAKGS